MAATTLSKSAPRARPRGLSVKTNLPVDESAYMDKSGEAFYQVFTAPAHKQDFGPIEPPSKHEVSKALLNDDWRHKWRPDGDNATEWFQAVPPRRVKFNENEAKSTKKKLRIDTSLANVGEPRRYRDERDTPIDLNMILSAPATKQEYRLVIDEDESQQLSHGGDGQMDTSIQSTDYVKISLGPKQLVRLDLLSPHTDGRLDNIVRQYYDSVQGSAQGSESNSSLGSSWASGFGSVTPVTASTEDSYVQVDFPMAEMREVKNARNLKTKPWGDIDEEIKAVLQQFKTPLSDGLPAELMRGPREQGEQAPAAKTVLDDPAVQSMQVNGQQRIASSLPGVRKPMDEKSRFEALLAKLQKASAAHGIRISDPKAKKAAQEDLLAKFRKATAAHNLRICDPAILDVKSAASSGSNEQSQPEESKAHHVQPMKRSSSADSAISGVSASTSQKAKTLNPKATAFFAPSGQKQQPATINNGSPLNFNRPPVAGLFDAPPQAPQALQASVLNPSLEDYMALLARLEGMEAQISQLTEAQLHTIEAQKQRLIHQLNANQLPGFDALQTQAPMMPPQNQMLRQWMAARGFEPPPGIATPMPNGLPRLHLPHLVQNAANPASAPMTPQQMQRNQSVGPVPGFTDAGLVNRAQHMPPPGLHISPVKSGPVAQKPMPGPMPGLPQGPPQSFLHSLPKGLSSTQFPFPIPKQGPPQGPVSGLMPGTTPAPISFPPFGPRPVRKPKGPFRPGDVAQAKQQQEYEAYLEWRRANDLEYAQQCKARQSKRAERLQTEKEKSESGASSYATPPEAPAGSSEEKQTSVNKEKQSDDMIF